jgi:hypothetical protein
VFVTQEVCDSRVSARDLRMQIFTRTLALISENCMTATMLFGADCGLMRDVGFLIWIGCSRGGSMSALLAPG